MPAIAVATDVSCRMTPPSASARPEAPSSRLAAAQHLVMTISAAPPPSLNLMACALAEARSGLAVAFVEGSGEWSVSHADTNGLAALRSLLDEACAEYGAPSVAVEPARPSRPEDRAACRDIMSALASLGIRALDGDAERIARRNAADRAVSEGMDGTHAREIVDRMDADFTLRVGAIQRASSAPAYQLVMHSVEVEVTLHLTRVGSADAGAIAPVFSSARSTSADAAARQALQAALSDATAAAASAICTQWIKALDGSMPWTVELVGSPERCLDDMRRSQPALLVLEHRPGVRSVLQGPPDAVRSLAIPADGLALEQSRPGYLRISCVPATSGVGVAWAAAFGLGAAACVALLLRRKARAASRPMRGGAGGGSA